MKQQYTTEVEHLHRMNEEALIAVKVATYESGTEINRLKEEYSTRFYKETSQINNFVEELKEKVEIISKKYQQTSVCLYKIVSYSEQQDENYEKLLLSYRILKNFYRNHENIMNIIDNLVNYCYISKNNTTAAVSSSNSTLSIPIGMQLQDNYIFDSILNPLEETNSKKRITFKIVALAVLANVRFNTLLQYKKAQDHVYSSETVMEFSLPPLYELTDKTPIQIAQLLKYSLHSNNSCNSSIANSNNSIGYTTVGRGLTSTGRGLNPPQSAASMSMADFDAYLQSYDFSHTDPPTHIPATTTGTTIGTIHKNSKRSTKESSLLQYLNYTNNNSNSSTATYNTSSVNNSPSMRNLTVLYKTLSDMSKSIASNKDKKEQFEVSMN